MQIMFNSGGGSLSADTIEMPELQGQASDFEGGEKIIKSGITEIRGNTSACLRSKEKRRHETNEFVICEAICLL